MQIVSVKAFGDFVIALTALERAAAADRGGLSILAADHLRPLAEAAEPTCRVDFLGNGEAGVPAIFDIRRAGVPAATRSSWRLKRAISRARDRRATLITDKAGWRERWLTSPARSGALPPAANIYIAYQDFLAAAGIASEYRSPATTALDREVVGIFPGSRVAAKNMPLELVRSALATVEREGRCARLYLLDGERPDLERSGLPFVAVPRRFDALMAAIAAVGSVIGADSLPVHLAEREGRPVFVLSPRPNTFWLPHSSLMYDRWAMFDAALDTPLARFLDVK